MEEVFIEPYITIKLDQQQQSVISDWTGSPTTEQFMNGKEQVFTVLTDSSSTIIVLNYEHLAAYINLETQVWTVNEWFPKVLKDKKIKRLGIVIPSKVMAQIVVKAIFSGVHNQLADEGIEIAYFDNKEQLHQWLQGNDSGQSISTTTQAPQVSNTPSMQMPTEEKKNTNTVGGVSLGGPSSTPDYNQLDDVIHDDPFA